MKVFILTIITFLFANPSFAQKSLDELLHQYNTRSIPYISVEELRMLQMHKKVVIIDSREKDEFDVSHISGAQFVGFNTFSSEEISEKIKDKNTPIVVYCSLGIRSEEIGEKLKKAGFIDVQNLYGGIFEWKNKGYPVFDSLNVETEKVHVFSKPWGKWLSIGTKIFD